jgi:hypothetical protein
VKGTPVRDMAETLAEADHVTERLSDLELER